MRATLYFDTKGRPRKPIGIKRRKRKPLCLCNCGRRVKRWCCRYYSRACTSHIRAETLRKIRASQTYQFRAALFRVEIDQLGERIKREDLLACFQRVYKRGYSSGWVAGKNSLRQLPERRSA